MGTAIGSSNRFGGRGTIARSRVQVRTTVETEAGTVFPTQHQTGGYCQGELLPGYVTYIDVRCSLEQRIKVGVFGRFGVGGEDRGIHVNVNFGTDLGQTTPALTLHETVKAAPPQVLTLAGGLQLPGDRYRTYQLEVEPIERGIVGLELSHGADRTSLKVPNIHSQHSRLK